MRPRIAASLLLSESKYRSTITYVSYNLLTIILRLILWLVFNNPEIKKAPQSRRRTAGQRVYYGLFWEVEDEEVSSVIDIVLF